MVIYMKKQQQQQQQKWGSYFWIVPSYNVEQ